MKKGSTPILQSKTKLVTCQLLLLVAIFLFWWLMTKPGLIPPFMFQDENQAAFFFGEPVQIGKVIWDWFAVNLEMQIRRKENIRTGERRSSITGRTRCGIS